MEIEKKMVMSSNKRTVWSALVLVILVILTYEFLLWYVPELVSFIKLLHTDSVVGTASILHTAKLLWQPVVACVFLTGITCLIINIKKPLRSWNEAGVTKWSIVGMALGYTYWLGFTVLLMALAWFWGDDFRSHAWIFSAITILWLVWSLTTHNVAGIIRGFRGEFKVYQSS